jgi:hypothetical protein
LIKEPSGGKRRAGIISTHARDNGVISQAESDEKILTFDVPDEVLERAASAEQNALTMLYCTADWYSCGLPQIVAF